MTPVSTTPRLRYFDDWPPGGSWRVEHEGKTVGWINYMPGDGYLPFRRADAEWTDEEEEIAGIYPTRAEAGRALASLGPVPADAFCDDEERDE